MVVVGKLIHGNLQGGSGKVRHMVVHGSHKALRISIHIDPVVITVLLHSGQKPRHGLHKGIIIHHGIPLSAVQPLSGTSVVLCDYDGIRIRLPDRLAEHLPEIVVELRRMAQIRCHIKPPSVRIIGRGYPFSRNTQHIIKQILGSLIIKLGQRVMSPPPVVVTIVRPGIFIIKLKIIPIRASGINISPFFIALYVLVNSLLVHPFVEGAAVIKHTVQYHPDSPAVRLLHHPGKKRIACLQVLPVRHPVNIPGCKPVLSLAVGKQLSLVLYDPSEMRINIIIILYVVFVI